MIAKNDYRFNENVNLIKCFDDVKVLRRLSPAGLVNDGNVLVGVAESTGEVFVDYLKSLRREFVVLAVLQKRLKNFIIFVTDARYPTSDLLIRTACFVSDVNNIFIIKGDNLN